MDFYQYYRSALNSVFWRVRRGLRFRRRGYQESLSEPAVFSDEAHLLNQNYKMDSVRSRLSAFNGARNLASLWYLEQMLAGRSWPKKINLLEPGCQDFSRLPAWRAYFNKLEVETKITGIEVDPFPVLQDLHSRWDKAQYYISLANDGAEYSAADFFKWMGEADVIFCFYPFVSVGPALAWGLPAEFASAEKWIQSFERVLKDDGLLLVVHQGPWEENDFDQAREDLSRKDLNSHLHLEKRKVLECPFFKTAHPMCASLYSKKKSPH